MGVADAALALVLHNVTAFHWLQGDVCVYAVSMPTGFYSCSVQNTEGVSDTNAFAVWGSSSRRPKASPHPSAVSAVLGTWSCISHAVASASLARDRAETSSESHADCQRSRLGRCGEGGYTRRCLNVHQTAVLLQTMPWHPNPLTPIGSLAQCPFQTHQPFEPATST